MKDIVQIAIILAIIVAIIIYVTRFHNPIGYQEIERKTTTKYEKESPSTPQKIETKITRTEKPTREGGSKITVKEHVKAQ